MLAFFLLSCLFIKEGIALRLLMAFAPSRVGKYVEPRQKKVSRRIFSVLRAYSGFGYALAVDSYPVSALPERFLVVCNHQSLLDIALVFCVFAERSVRFVAKGSLGRGIPFVSILLRYGGHCLVAKTGTRATMKSLERFAARCRERGFCPVIFPEGTRSKTGKLGEFNSAGFRKLAEGSGLPIVAVALEGGFDVSTVRKLLDTGRKAGYRVTVMPPAPAAKDKHEVHAALLAARAAIESRVGA